MKKLLLINPGHLAAPNWGWRSFPAHLHHMWSALAEHGEVEVVDYNLHFGAPPAENRSEFLEAVRSDLEQRDFDIAGISCWSSLNVTASIAVAGFIRNSHPGAKIVIGGYHPTARPQDFPEEFFDSVVRGCGIKFLQNAISENGPPGDRVLIEETPIIVKPRWDGFPYGAVNGALGIYLSRGCPYSCTFCMENVMGRRWMSLDPVEAAEAVAEAIRISKTPFLQIYDPLFGLNPNWRREFMEQLVKRKRQFDRKTFLWAQVRTESFRVEDFKYLRHFNFQLAIGLESASSPVLQIMNKSHKPEQYLRRFAEFSHFLDRKKIHHQIFLIFNHPGETPVTLVETRAWLLNLLGQKRKSYLTIQGQPYVYFPGSPLDDKLEELKQNHGTKILYPTWWLEEEDHYAKASAVIPSAALETAGQMARWKDVMNEISIRNLEVSSKANRPDVESFRNQLKILSR